jgi:hypothetical protein
VARSPILIEAKGKRQEARVGNRKKRKVNKKRLFSSFFYVLIFNNPFRIAIILEKEHQRGMVKIGCISIL